MHRVVFSNWQVHTQQPLWRASQDDSMRKAPVLAGRAVPESPGMGTGEGLGAGLRELHTQQPKELDWICPNFMHLTDLV